MLYVSLAATAGTLPFMLYHFNRFSLIGPVMNLLIEPLLCLWALPCGLLGIFLLSISPDLAALLFQIGGAGIRLALVLTRAVIGFPYASIWTITPSFLEILLFFVILFLLLQRKQTPRRLSLATVFSLVLLFSFTLSLWHPAKTKELTVNFLDVGQGTSTLLQLPNGKKVLVDGGGHQTDHFNTGQSIIAPFLWRKRIWRLDDLVITHPHKDHYNGLPFVYAHFQPKRLIVNGDKGDEPAYGQFMETVREKGTPILIAGTGDKLQQDKELRLECLGMNDLIDHSSGWSINDRSLVLRLQFGERSFLFPADIGIQSENRLMRQQDHLRSDVLLAPHHGSKTSAGQDFIAAVSPAMIVVSAGRARQGTLPAPQHLEDWRQKKILSLVTAQQGTTTCTTDGKALRIDTFTGDLYLFSGEAEEILKKK
jgi:competence protein ComEC